MRLTVRTLLAYMDRVLEPADSDELEAKIRSSQLAQTLIERIHGTLSQARLSAPPVDGRGSGGDPNTVAEYLDNTLVVDRVPEFERICLESDMQLAEAAGCHQILSLASGKSTSVTTGLRQRLYRLPESEDANLPEATKNRPGNGSETTLETGVANSESRSELDPRQQSLVSADDYVNGSVKRRTDPAHLQKYPVAHGANVVSSTPVLARTTSANMFAESRLSSTSPSIRGRGIDLANDKLASQVPEYLRGRRRHVLSQSWISAALLVLFLLFGWQSIGSIARVRKLLSPSTSAAFRGDARDPSQVQSNVEPQERLQVQANERDSEGSVDSLPDSGNSQGLNHSNSVVPSKSKMGSNDPVVPGAGSKTLVDSSNSEAVNSARIPIPMSDPRRETSDAIKPDTSANSSPETSSIDSTQKPSVDGLGPRPTPTISGPGRWMPADRLESESVVLSLEHVAGGAPRIARLNPGQNLEFSRRIVIPPYYRTLLLLGPGLKWTVAGPSNLAILKPKSADIVNVSIQLGRAILESSPECKAARLEWQDQSIEIRFDDAASSCSIQLGYLHPPGVDLNQPNALVPNFQLFGVNGSFTLTTNQIGQLNSTSNGKTIRVNPKQSFTWVRGKEPVIGSTAQFPVWQESSIERPIDRIAARDLYRYMMNAQSADLLAEFGSLTREKRPETAALATRTLMLLGDYSSLFGQDGSSDGLLSRAAARGHWKSILDSLWDSLGSHPQSPLPLQTALDGKVPMRAGVIRNLLVGFSASNLSVGGDKILVDALASRHMDERVIAAYQLQSITGQDFGFVADQPNPESLVQWRKEMASGKIRIPINE